MNVVNYTTMQTEGRWSTTEGTLVPDTEQMTINGSQMSSLEAFGKIWTRTTTHFTSPIRDEVCRPYFQNGNILQYKHCMNGRTCIIL